MGGPLAAAKDAPLLLTASGQLDKPVATEVRRVLPSGGTVFLLGGRASLTPAVARRLTGLGYRVHRLGGATRYDTAVAVAGYLSHPKAVLLATGADFPDALTASDAAAHEHGVVLLTQGTAMPAPTKTWLAQHPALPVWAVGGPAASAAPCATALVGQDRYATAVATATTLFGDPGLAGVASGLDFPDALTAVGRLGHLDAPLLLTAPTLLSAPTRAYLTAHAGTLSTVELYGGRAALGSGVQAGVTDAVGGISG